MLTIQEYLSVEKSQEAKNILNYYEKFGWRKDNRKCRIEYTKGFPKREVMHSMNLYELISARARKWIVFKDKANLTFEEVKSAFGNNFMKFDNQNANLPQHPYIIFTEQITLGQFCNQMKTVYPDFTETSCVIPVIKKDQLAKTRRSKVKDIFNINSKTSGQKRLNLEMVKPFLTKNFKGIYTTLAKKLKRNVKEKIQIKLKVGTFQDPINSSFILEKCASFGLTENGPNYDVSVTLSNGISVFQTHSKITELQATWKKIEESLYHRNIDTIIFSSQQFHRMLTQVESKLKFVDVLPECRNLNYAIELLQKIDKPVDSYPNLLHPLNNTVSATDLTFLQNELVLGKKNEEPRAIVSFFKRFAVLNILAGYSYSTFELLCKIAKTLCSNLFQKR